MVVHVIAYNYGTHKHPKVWTWLAHHPRFTMHYTPTYSSWLNQVERWFGHISEKAIRRDSFCSAKELVSKIEEFVAHYNEHARPFVWTATADSILKKVEKICKLICGTEH
jgi:putative transposase